MFEEKELELTIENNEWQPVANMEEMKKKMQKTAANTYIKDQRMNIRIAQKDLEKIKTKALEEGLPYQTLVASILHKYVNGRLVEKQAQ